MLKNIKISHKLIISTLVFVIPLVALLYFVVMEYNSDIERSISEKNGNITIGRIVKLTNEMIEYENLINIENENFLQSDGERSDVRKEEIIELIDSALIKVSSECKPYKDKLEQILKSNEENQENYTVENLQAIWKNIKNVQDKDREEYFANFYKKSLLLIRFIADESGLVLDPDLDSYYLMSISALEIPKLQIDFGNIFNIVTSSYANKVIYDFEANQVKLLSNIISNETIPRIERDIASSIREDANYYSLSPTLAKNLNTIFDNYKNDIGSLNIELKKWYSNEADDNEEILYKNLVSKSSLVLRNTKILWSVVNEELNILIDMRINQLEKIRNYALLSSSIGIVLAILFMFVVSKKISNYLGLIIDISRDIADGNINKAVNELDSNKRLGIFNKLSDDNIIANDEIVLLFKSIKKMTHNLASLLAQVAKSGEIVSDSTFKIISSAREIEATVSEQAALTNEVNATSNDISETSTELANTMGFLTDSFHNNAMMLFEGLQKLNEIKININDLYSSTNLISEKLDIIKSKVTGINTVILTITKVANQTNLVSLNASIEAERAGAYGTGFAVVAREIRRLADQTSIAALNIEDMINDMQIAVNEGGDTIVKYMENTKNSTEKTTQIIDQISSVIDKTNELPEKIFLANMSMKQQSESAVQINDSMRQLNIAAIQTRNTIVEFNNATEKLNSAVSGLTTELHKFTIDSISRR